MNIMSGASARQRKQQATALLQAGKVAEAKEIFEALSEDARRDPDVWHLLGACHGMLGDDVKAENSARKAIALRPEFSGSWVNLGSALLKQHKLPEAESVLREAIKRAPGDAQAYNNLGNVYHEMKKSDEAEKCYREALRLQPNFPDALTNLGLALQDRGEVAEATTLHRRALALDAQHANAHYNLGYALQLLGEMKAALPYLERFTQLRPGEARGWIAFGTVSKHLGDVERAVHCYEHCLKLLDPDNVESLVSVGNCYLAMGRREKSIAPLTRALELEPDNIEARYWLAAAGVGTPPESMAPDAVAKLFDGYANTFDEHLVGPLRYTAPASLSTALRRVLGAGPHSLRLLDLGCGTGLVGAEVRDIATLLVGVDLSPKMIEIARKRGIYDEIHLLGIMDYMEGAPRQYDAVLSADVFIYIGDLDDVFAAVSRCLVAAGLFVFSAESHTGDEPYLLRTSGRYAQSLRYLRELAARHGFTELSVEPVTLREESRLPVEGYVVALRKL
jgi:predicted TPR repeat methyltransferase